MIEALRNELGKRSWWMNLIFAFCLYMTFIYMPFDIFLKPVAEDEEVWFGFTLHGFWAKATAPLHWLIYAGLAWGFSGCRVGCGLGPRFTRPRLRWPCWFGTCWTHAAVVGALASSPAPSSCCPPLRFGGREGPSSPLLTTPLKPLDGF